MLFLDGRINYWCIPMQTFRTFWLLCNFSLDGTLCLSGDKNAEFVQVDHCLRDKHFANKHRRKLSLIGLTRALWG